MLYHLLTGATGLLGSYLLRDMLLGNRRVAVLVRDSHREPARQRIETILSRFERELGFALPRPVVLEGDITLPTFGLGPQPLQWISAHCDSIVHSAASLTFQASPRNGEPWRSNVEGTRHALELCHATGIGHFHHVSTAYVCGLRTGRVREDELDLGQAFGNEYEKTKVQAETLVRRASFLKTITVYRPAIIVGDSATGYTTTFHGFYTPLKIVHALVHGLRPDQIDGKPLMMALGLTGMERKNFVPVDWVSAVIADLLSRPACRGKVYHLVPRKPTEVRCMCEVMEQTVRTRVKAAPRTAAPPIELAGLADVFRNQMDVYRAYWRDDPEFDTTNTLQAVPHRPCPDVDRHMLTRLATFALETNFGWPRPQPAVPEFDVAGRLRGIVNDKPLGQAARSSIAVGLQVNGAGGGQWTTAIDDRRRLSVAEGLSPQCKATVYMNAATLRQLVELRRTPENALRNGQVLVMGESLPLDRLVAILQTLILCLPARSAAALGSAVVPQPQSIRTPIDVAMDGKP
jgi:thioester reductase-like protein